MRLKELPWWVEWPILIAFVWLILWGLIHTGLDN